MLDNATGLMPSVGRESYFIAFNLVATMLAACTFMDMLTGVRCEVVSSVVAVDREEALFAFVRGGLANVVNSSDKYCLALTCRRPVATSRRRTTVTPAKVIFCLGIGRR